MPTSPTAPGTHIRERSSGVHTISGVPTAVTAFVGYVRRGLDHTPKRILSYADYERTFGVIDPESELSYAVKHFYDNGGAEAWIVRVPKSDGKQASIGLKTTVTGTTKAFDLTARSTGACGNKIIVDVDHDGTDSSSFNLSVTDLATGEFEVFNNLSLAAGTQNIATVINDPINGSSLVHATAGATTGRPPPSGTVGNTAILTAGTAATAETLGIKIDVPAITIANITIFEVGDVYPTSIATLCRVVERKVNQHLSVNGHPVTISCLPTKIDVSGVMKDAMRVQASVPDRPDDLVVHDLVVTFTAGTTNDASARCGLNGLTASDANVSHYVLGAGRVKTDAPVVDKAQVDRVAGVDGTALPLAGDLINHSQRGIYALKHHKIAFNLLCLPDATRAKKGTLDQLDNNLNPNEIYSAAMKLCQDSLAFLIIDPPPPVRDVDSAADWKNSGLSVVERNGAAYFPRLWMPDPANGGKPRLFAPCGVVAGMYARTDANVGVWKAPAGTEVTLMGVHSLGYKLSDDEHGVLNPLGLNCFRAFPTYGMVSWGARTLVGSDAAGDEWKYVPVRRMALFIEQTLKRALIWATFRPNDEPLWAQMRLSVGAFMQDLFTQGAFKGASARDAYFVKCDAQTNTPITIDRGEVHLQVGFAPLKPAEFVIITLQQKGGQQPA